MPPRAAHSSAFVFVALLALLVGWPGSRVQARPPTPEPPPNFVFVLADDLGIHDLACYGRHEHRTPNLDRLAWEGTRFTDAYCAQPICSPSRAAILSGLHPARLHLTTFLPGRADTRSQRLLQPRIIDALPAQVATLPERLRVAGYATACLGKWHLGGRGAGPETQGFDVVHAGQANTAPTETEGGKGEFDLTAQAESFIEANRERPFFLYLAHHTPHIPYSARTNLVARYAREGVFEPGYAAVVETLDESVGRLLARIDALGLRDRTVVIFTSDNGGIHVPELQHPRITHNGPFRAGKGFLHEGGLRIPLIVRWPGRVPSHRVTSEPTVNTDWLPTLLELAGLPAPDRVDGISIAPWLLGKSRPEARRFFWHFPHYTNQGGRPAGAVRDGRWKFIESYDTGEIALYDLRSDPGETTDLHVRETGRTERLRRALGEWRRVIGAQGNQPNPACDAELFSRLYLDFDPSRFAPRSATATEWERAKNWRTLMDEVTRPP